jgi:hypothetical protein
MNAVTLIHNIAVIFLIIGAFLRFQKWKILRALQGPCWLATMLLYAMTTSNTFIPEVGLIILQLAVCAFALLYILTGSEVYIVIQFIMLIIPGNFVFTEEMSYGVLSSITFVAIMFAYEWMMWNMERAPNVLYAFNLTIPIFRLSYVFLLAYAALIVLLHSFIMFQILTPRITKEDEDEENQPLPQDIEDLQAVPVPTSTPVVETIPAHVVHQAVSRVTLPAVPRTISILPQRPLAKSVNHNVTEIPRPKNVSFSETVESKTTGSFISKFYSS